MDIKKNMDSRPSESLHKKAYNFKQFFKGYSRLHRGGSDMTRTITAHGLQEAGLLDNAQYFEIENGWETQHTITKLPYKRLLDFLNRPLVQNSKLNILYHEAFNFFILGTELGLAPIGAAKIIYTNSVLNREFNDDYLIGKIYAAIFHDKRFYLKKLDEFYNYKAEEHPTS